MAYTDIHSEDRLVQATFAEHLERVLGWDSVYAFNQETFGPTGTLGRTSERDAVLVRDLRDALRRLNPQLALFDLVQRGDLNKTECERIKQDSRDLLERVLAVIAPLDRWTEKEQTQAEVESFILDQVYLSLPEPPYTSNDKADVAQLVYRHIWQQSVHNTV